jgi:hypothetical protein
MGTNPSLLSDSDLTTFRRLNDLMYGPNGPYKAYRANPGEVEAFATGDRQFMTAEERRANPPSLKDASFDVRDPISGRVQSRVTQGVLDYQALTERLNKIENGPVRAQQRVFGRRRPVTQASNLGEIDDFDRGMIQSASVEDAFKEYMKGPRHADVPLDTSSVGLTKKEFDQWRATRVPKNFMGEVGDLYPK